MEVNLEVVPLDGTDEFHQKCYLDPEHMLHLGARIGTFVRVTTRDGVTLCSVWPGTCTANPSFQFSSVVHCPTNVDDNEEGNSEDNPVGEDVPNMTDSRSGNEEALGKKRGEETQSQCCNRIKVIRTCSAKMVSVVVIFSDISMLEKFRDHKTIWKQLQEQCLNCLHKLCVMRKCVIELESYHYAKLCGIAKIVVKDASANVDSDCVEGLIINQNTEVHIDSVHSKDWYSQMYTRNPVVKPGGMNDVVNMLADLLQMPLKYREQFDQLGVDPPSGILFRGPPGCGKTSVVKYVSNLCKAFLISVNGPAILGPLPGESEANLRAVFDRASRMSKEGPCILFFDEIDSVCPRKGNSGGLQQARVTAQFATLMDELHGRQNLVVIGATNRASALDPALRRPGRLDREVIISAPTQPQRREILTTILHDLPVVDDLDLDHLSEVTNGYVGADLAGLCHEAAYLAMAECTSSMDKIPITGDHLLAALKKSRPSLQKGAEGVVDLRPVSWSDIGGLEQVKAQLRQTIEWPVKHPEAFKRMGVPPPKGVLLYGPPGCCKTTLVRASATACRATFLSISGAQLYSPYVGDSERLIMEVFQKARATAPAIVFLDEIDSIVGRRSESGQGRGVQERVLSTLLNEMDGVGVRLDDTSAVCSQQKLLDGDNAGQQHAPGSGAAVVPLMNRSVVVVAATNRPDLLDEALVRPGRIDRVVYVPPPDSQARRKILAVYTKSMDLNEEDIDAIVSHTELFTGADLENLCREAALSALTEDLCATMVTRTHFLRARNSVKPSLTDKIIKEYSNINMSTFKQNR